MLWGITWGLQLQFDAINFKVDVKGMRKLEKADQLQFVHRGAEAFVGEINACLVMFFKLA